MTIKEDKKEHILDVAEKVFAEMGYEGASTRFLAKEAGVNMAMLNYYFGSKDGLLRAVVVRKSLGMRQALDEVMRQNDSSWDKLFQAVDLYLNRLLANNCFHRLIHRESSLLQRSDMSEMILDHVLTNVNTIIQIIKEGIQNGTFRDVDAELTVANVFGTKYYIVNSTQITSQILGLDLQDPKVMELEVKPRVKKFLYDLLKAHLTKHDL